jgi:hypothetical protein
MESLSAMEVARAVVFAIALAACAGLRAWLPLLLVGALARFDWITLGPSWRFLASNQALLLFGAATVIEILGDKIAAVDHVLDAISTVLRPAAGALLAASVLSFVHDPLLGVVAGAAIGAPAALVPHALKSGLRVVSSGLTAGFANPILSVIEDVFSLILFALAVLVPLLVVLMLLAGAIFLTSRVSRRKRVAAGTQGST